MSSKLFFLLLTDWKKCVMSFAFKSFVANAIVIIEEKLFVNPFSVCDESSSEAGEISF